MQQENTHIFVVPLLSSRMSCFTAMVYNSSQHSKETRCICK